MEIKETQMRIPMRQKTQKIKSHRQALGWLRTPSQERTEQAAGAEGSSAMEQEHLKGSPDWQISPVPPVGETNDWGALPR